ncbi:peptidyl-prolyl cis-trans isomerase [Actinoplanes sp. RD1]|uniref:peptidyl-prolyl cis-trans isomerase n=1 Tax=Actinoplanes sp. RD1 TaxID=3064538 RepID=UPI002740F5E2|nr:peptidyl-prolyl cis-trans isomerase [Actinoplanes sp. RD1]
MKRRLLGAGGVSALLAAIVVTAVVAVTRTDEVASVAGHPVTRDELAFHMSRLAPAVLNEQGSTGTLRQRALDEIKHDKTLLIVAQEQGLLGSVDHDDFLAEVDAENEARATADTVYGVTSFSPEEYYTHRMTDLTTALEKKLGATGGPLAVPDAEVRAAFDADRSSWSANATRYTYSTLVVPDSAAARAKVAASRTLKAAGVPGARYSTATHDGSVATGLNGHDQEVMAVLGTLDPGQISAPVAGGGQVTYYQLDSETVDADAAFAAYSSRIRQSLLGEKFTQFLQRRVDATDMDVDRAAVDAVNPEDVR